MHPLLRASTASSRLLACVFIITATSCIKVTDRVIPDTSIRYDQGESFDGPPRATLNAHPDHQGWTVTVTQPLKRHVELVRSQREEHHHYYLNPLTLPAGAFSCSSSVWSWFWTAVATVLDSKTQIDKQQTLLDFTWTSCLMALMIVRTRPELVNMDSVVEYQTEPDTRPVIDGKVTVSWQGPAGDTELSYPLQEGRALVRLSHITTALRQDHGPSLSLERSTIQLSAWHQGHLLERWLLNFTAKELEAAEQEGRPVIAPRSHWPRPLVFKIIGEAMPTMRTNPEGAFLRLLLQHGIAVVGSEEQGVLARRELERNLDSIVEDSTVMGPGHWTAATMLLLLTNTQSNGSWALTVSCINIRTREVLARLDVAAAPNNAQGTLDVALMRFQDILHSLTSKHTR